MQEKHETFDKDEKPNLKGEYRSIAVLFFLYVLQGVPMGISNSMSVLLQNRGVSYADQTIFSMAVYPFILKILWAPIVDSVYCKAFGRRKTWLVPTQILIGAAMLFLAQKVDTWFGDEATQKPEVILITIVFFLLWLLTATQDIAVDGWALTMLQRKNVGYAATVNNVGQSFGALLGYVVFLTLESKDFCNKYIFHEPQAKGLITFSGFLTFWGVSFLTVTVVIAIFKRESSEDDKLLAENPDFGITKAYPILWKIIKLKPVLFVAAILSTADISFAAADMITFLKLIDYGIPRDKIAMFNFPSFIVQLSLPILISKYTAGKYPLRYFIKAFPYRLILSVVIAVFVYVTPTILEGKLHDIPVSYYASIMTIVFLYQITYRSMGTAEMAFFARVADPLVGGTYMTLMNICYFLSRLFRSFSLWLVDVMTFKTCVFISDDELFNSTVLLTENKCNNDNAKNQCRDNGGICRIDIDGYYIEVALNVLYGIFWYQWGKRTVKYLQSLPVSDWHVLSNNIKKSDADEEKFPLEKAYSEV